MKIKDQIRARREQLGMSIVQLAERLGVTDQAVRYWEAGRSNPGKRIAQKLEEQLDFRLDWTEGARHSGDRRTINALIDQNDIDLLLLICRLPFDAKNLLGDFARVHLRALEGRKIDERETTDKIPPFLEKKQEQLRANKTTKAPRPRARTKAG